MGKKSREKNSAILPARPGLDGWSEVDRFWTVLEFEVKKGERELGPIN